MTDTFTNEELVEIERNGLTCTFAIHDSESY